MSFQARIISVIRDSVKQHKSKQTSQYSLETVLS